MTNFSTGGQEIVLPNPANPFGWIRGAGFDLTLIAGVAALSFLSAWIYCQYPALFPTILFLDLWFLGYHHVVATFTRLTFDTGSYREHKFLVVWVPIIIVALSLPIVFVTGPWILATTYLYWQWYHYTRQSYGISKVYQRKAKRNSPADDLLENGIIYLMPIWGIMARSHQNPGQFLGLELKVIPVSSFAMECISTLTVAVLILWSSQKILLAFKHQLDIAHTLYQISHLLIFWVGYIVITDINFGWLMVNIWHNAQYVLFVWMYNNNRFKTGVDPTHKFLSFLSQSKNLILYFAVCILIAGIVYKSIDMVLKVFAVSTLPLAVLVYQTINFHHYVVDGVVWKIRKKPMQQTLGIVD